MLSFTSIGLAQLTYSCSTIWVLLPSSTVMVCVPYVEAVLW